MSENKFDDKIRELLNEVHEDYDNASWDKLSERLDHVAENSSTGVDYVSDVKEKLNNHRVEVSEKHWSSMKTDLELIEARRKRLYIVKAFEAAIVLLLVFTYFNYKSLSGEVKVDMAYIEEIQSQNVLPELINADITLDDQIEEKILQNFTENRSDPYPAKINKTYKWEQLSLIHSGAGDLSKVLSIKEDPLGEITNVPPILSMKDIDRIPVEIRPYSIDEIKIEAPAYAILSDNVIVNKPTWSIGIPFSFDANFINTDLNLGYLSYQIKSGLGGHSYGLSLGYRKGNVELESGLRFSRKTFVPGQLTNYFKHKPNEFEEHLLDHMVIRQIQIPLLAKMYATPYRKATFYGMLGVAINAIYANEYTIQETIQTKARFAFEPTSEIVDLLTPPPGFAQEGGSLGDNIYVTGVVGFGIQSDIAEGIRWYLQPQYHHSFSSEINQIVSKINSLSLEGGVKFSF